MNLLYLALIGHGLSLISLFISLAIFFHFKWANKLHLNIIYRHYHLPIHNSLAWLCNVVFLSLQEFKLPKDYTSQKPLPVVCSQLCDHHHLVDSSGKQSGAGAEESSEFVYLCVISLLPSLLDHFIITPYSTVHYVAVPESALVSIFLNLHDSKRKKLLKKCVSSSDEL